MADRARNADLNRLIRAVTLLTRQQWERVTWGGPGEVDDVSDEDRRIAGQVLPLIEQALDEDLVMELNQGGPPMPWLVWPTPERWRRSYANPFSFFNPFLPPPGFGMDVDRPHVRGAVVTDTDELLNRVLADFSHNMSRLFRNAHRERRTVSEQELTEELTQLKSDLDFVAERSQREHRRDKDEWQREEGSRRRTRDSEVRDTHGAPERQP